MKNIFKEKSTADTVQQARQKEVLRENTTSGHVVLTRPNPPTVKYLDFAMI